MHLKTESLDGSDIPERLKGEGADEQRKDLALGMEQQVMSTGSDQGVSSQPISPAAAKKAAIREVSSWAGVRVGDRGIGGIEFRVGRRELGHLHKTFADLPFPRGVRDEMVRTGRAQPHHVAPDSGWVTVPMTTAAEVAAVVQLLRQNYERAARRQPPKRRARSSQ